ncbi:hypothetical protein Desor_5100 [Desulfosporosinus orientis DSM 765]|uniref:Microcin J25-processing protein McjB C-terminal domain-containing protein n=1 Tax=Desulfosporosinus orientis (strain ATCC 19365 / DSM 765 / NCIMB 8382 / VKM B-1628 / Singapore I) TaxID=768706 RepID=G7WJQ4_DESOD|nr:lasso peptide biosynthesis B2 protein [Desulfosporosinus orientis]AET70491.1 hypothetical protein Desor_5100 [Desulfosporosinus orientis DSM 765]
MKHLKKFIKLSWKIKLLLLGSLCLLGIVRLAILIIPFRYLTLFMGRKMVESPNEISSRQLLRALKVGWSVNKVSNFTPWESKCLVRAFTTQIILRLLTIPSTLYLGIAKTNVDQLHAHAWLRCGNCMITGASEREKFKSVAHFSVVPFLFDPKQH